MLTLKNLRLLFGGSGQRKSSDAERLDAFLTDPALVRSLREDDHRRKRLPLILVSLLLGLLFGAAGVLVALHPWRPAPAIRAGAPSSEEMARVLASQAQVFAKAKEIDRALSYSRLATELAPHLVDTWDALAYSLFYAGQTAEAETAIQRCLKIDPGYHRAYHILGDINFYTGDWKQAEAYWKKADAKRALARLLLLKGRFAEAAPLAQGLAPGDRYTRVISDALRLGRLTPDLQRQLAPDFVASRDPETARGWQLFYARRYDEAATTFSRALSHSPRDGSALIGKGWCLLKIGTTPREAQSAFEQARATWPTSYSALNGLAWSLKAQEQAEGAVTLWRQVIDLPRVDQMEVASCYKGLGTVYYERGDYTRANQYLALSVMRDPFDEETKTLLRSTLGKLSPP
ncbi:MAG: tetratricopeptide repeat protein [Thermoanaerobaculia bacterium]